MGLCGCNLKEKFVCSNGIPKGTIWHWIRISRSGDKQEICRIVEMKIRGNILCSKRTWRPALSMERIPSRHGQDWCNWHLPGAWKWKNLSLLLLFARRRPDVWCLVTAGECYLQVACVAWRFWLLSNKGGRGQKNREEIGAGATEKPKILDVI